MSTVDQNLETFLRRCLFRDGAESCSHFELRHAAPGSKGHRVEVFKPPSNPSPTELRPLVEEIKSSAQMDADGLGGTQRYVLNAYAEGDEKPFTRLPFRIHGGDESDPEEAGEEGPTSRGLMTQLMRHNESMARTLVNSMGAMLVGMGRRLDSNDKLIDRLMADRVSTLELVEKLRSDEHTRNMEMMAQQSSDERKDKIFEQLTLMFPIIVNKLAGKKVMASDEPFAAQVRAFSESLTPEQFNKMMGMFTLAQQSAIITILKDVQDSDAKSKPKLPAGSDKSDGAKA